MGTAEGPPADKAGGRISQAVTGFQLLSATGLPVATPVVAVYDLCEETCGPEQNCEEPCFPEPETGLITCGEYEDGWESGWCMEPYVCGAGNACGDGYCETAICGESLEGSTCCEEDCGSCSDPGPCEVNSDCGSGECCNADNECAPCSPPEPPNDPICNGECTSDQDCCDGGEICRWDGVSATGKCVTSSSETCFDSEECASSWWCNAFVPDCDDDKCYCSASVGRCLYLQGSGCPDPIPGPAWPAPMCQVPALR